MADFNVQRGTATIPDTATSVTITAGTEYTAPASATAAFIRIVGTVHTGAGDMSSGVATPPGDASCYISNPGNITTSITFSRDDTDGPTKVYWEIIEYVGAGAGGNEMIVRDVGTISSSDGQTSVDGASVGTVATDGDVVVFITGQAHNGGNAQIGGYNWTSEWVGSGTDVPRFTRGRDNFTSNLSYAVVEFTGTNWSIQPETHTYSAAGSTETETLGTSVGSTSKTFLHAQLRTAGANANQQGQEVWLSSTSQLSFLLDSGATVSSHVAVVWVIENTQSGGTTDMSVQRVNGSRGTGQSEPDSWTEAITAVSALATSSLMGECGTTDETGNTTEFQFILGFTATDTVTLERPDTGSSVTYRFEVVEWPEEDTGPAPPVASVITY